MDSFALLDDGDKGTARLYTELQQVLPCSHESEFASMLDSMQTALQQGLYAVAVLSYELGEGLHALSPNEKEGWQPSQIFLYRRCEHLTQSQVSAWLEARITQHDADESPAGIANIKPNVTEKEFNRAIEAIQRYIVSGDAYQINYTYRLHFETFGSIYSLYQRLRDRQPVPFGALIVMPEGDAILSFSPELFVQCHQGELLMRPMKGTMAALGQDDKTPAQRALQLANDSKNRAENVMIVDLVRNDLGRVAKPGSISVTQLFDVQQFHTVLQMTSTITAQCRDEVTLSDVLRAVYPSGSITGAPKHRAMQIIRELEPDARGIYTGAIGWFDPSPEKSMPNFCLSVPIRTAYVKAPCTQGLREGVMGIGAGIVFDSQAQDEYQECQLKGRFLTELPAPFSLFETMYATQEHGVRHWARHQARLKHSARYFSVPLDWPEIERQISNLHNAMQPGTPYRVKLSVNGLGHIAIEHAVLTPITTPVKILLSTTPQRPKTLWSQHKTTLRSDCDLAWQHAQRQGAFDTLLWNERGELTEGGRSNVLVKFKGRWVTPPQSAGVLPGVMRAVLMDDASWGLTEQTIHIDQLQHAEEIAVCNALRGVLVCDTRRGCKSHLL